MRRGLLAGLLLVAACEARKPKPPERPASITDEMVEAFDRDAALVRTIAEELGKTDGDCPRAAAVLRAHVDDFATLKKAAKQHRQKLRGDEAAKSWLASNYMSQDNVIAGMTLEAIKESCEDDPEFAAAVEAQLEASDGPD